MALLSVAFDVPSKKVMFGYFFPRRAFFHLFFQVSWVFLWFAVKYHKLPVVPVTLIPCYFLQFF